MMTMPMLTLTSSLLRADKVWPPITQLIIVKPETVDKFNSTNILTMYILFPAVQDINNDPDIGRGINK